MFCVFGSGFLYSRQTTSQPEIATPVQAKTVTIETGVNETQFVQQKTYGHSTKGRSITGYEFGSGERVLFLFGAIHGNEKGTATLMNELVKELIAQPTLVASGTKVVILPLTNPDGYLDREDKLNSNEVNLNRNFSTTDWDVYGEADAAGATPFSEVETRLLKQVVEELKPTMMLAFHAQGALVTPEFDPKSEALAKWYAKETGYDYFTDWDFAGTATKWFSESFQKAAITIELTEYEKSDWEMNKQALLKLVSQTGIPGIDR